MRKVPVSTRSSGTFSTWLQFIRSSSLIDIIYYNITSITILLPSDNMAKSASEIFNDLQQQSPTDRTVIIGGGIVGSALAYYLSQNETPSQIVLIDASQSHPQGSTAFAPGFVGQLNSISHLTQVAKESVKAYHKIPGAFDPVGGLEIARAEAGIAELHHRRELAHAAGLPADIISSEEASKIAPHFHAQDSQSQALFFSSDGTANAPKIAQCYQAEAKAKGVVVLEAKVSSIASKSSNSVDCPFSITTDLGNLEAKRVIIATGIWTQELLKSLDIVLPIIPVAHPYAYGPSRPIRDIKQPFIRWPERHIYARDHGEFDGFGSYDHKPSVGVPDKTALCDRVTESAILDSALSVFGNSTQRHSKTPYQGFNSMFSITPDSLPFAGAVPNIPGLFVAAAVWITHGAGVARLVADLVSGKSLVEEDQEMLKAFDVMRFAGQDPMVLERRALVTYNDIYNKEDHR
ncbi:DAO-domain-containing protein [Cadophora sp. DSE1049]|nr:DAO-domain-containing protein [Cadophora sp. DSE1049]